MRDLATGAHTLAREAMRQIERPILLIIAAFIAFGAVGGAMLLLVVRGSGSA